MRLLTALCLAIWPVTAAAQTMVEVDVELVLAVDVSRSISAEELQIQRRGYAAALTSDAVLAAIDRGMLGRIALSYVEWAGAGSQRVIVPWMLIAGREDAEAAAASILASEVTTLSRTSISGALALATQMIDTNAYTGLRRVIDVSGDGPNNHGAPVTEARDAAIARGITINGLPLMTSDGYSRFSVPDLDRYYAACVIGGSGAFVLPVTRWDAFADAVRRKLVLDIAAPLARIVPATAAAASTGTTGYDCLIGEKLWQRNRMLFDEP